MLSRLGIVLLFLSIMFADGAIVVPVIMALIGVSLIWLGKGFEDEADTERQGSDVA